MKFGLDVLARIPLDEKNAVLSDEGAIEDLTVEPLKKAADFIETL